MTAIIFDVVVGHIHATDSVELTREGRMVGDIRAPRVIIVDGASFRGRVDMGEVEPGRINAASRPQRPTVRSAPPKPPPPSKGEAKKGEKPLPPPPPAKTEAKKAPAPPAP